MGDLWWCNLCRIIQIPQSCCVDLNALTAVNLLRLAVSAWCQRLYCLHTEDPVLNEMTFADLFPRNDSKSRMTTPSNASKGGCGSPIEHFKDLVMWRDGDSLVQTRRKRLTSALRLQIDTEPFYMMTMFGRRSTNHQCWWPFCWDN